MAVSTSCPLGRAVSVEVMGRKFTGRRVSISGPDAVSAAGNLSATFGSTTTPLDHGSATRPA